MLEKLKTEIVGSADLAELFDVTERTIRNWVRKGHLPPPMTMRNKLRWHAHVIEEWLRRTGK